MEESILKMLLSARTPTLKYFQGVPEKMDYPEMTTIVQARFLQDLFSLEEHFDFLLIDTSAGLSRETMTYSLESDEAIVVTSIEPTSVMDCTQSSRPFRFPGPPNKFRC